MSGLIVPGAQPGGDPWTEAYEKLKACVDSGATRDEVTAYARELGRGLPDSQDPQVCARQAEAVAYVIRDIEGS